MQACAKEENCTSFLRWQRTLPPREHPHMIAENLMSATPASQLSLLPLPPRGEMERAYLRSDASYDGLFYLGVRTTGVFCRPSCHARKPKTENVEFFPSPKDAVFAGYRPCLKCKPVGGDAEPRWVADLLA
jgi:AraC family transcriptional regulator of adaptative response/methylated-DNA-[protein]-cysteine methyltransferase